MGLERAGTVAGLRKEFAVAIITHLRAHDYSFGVAAGFLLLALAALVLELYVRGPAAPALVAGS